jgi:hypothetical protein
MLNNVLLAAILGLVSTMAFASTYTGTVQKVIVASSVDTAGVTRVSVYTGGTTSCTDVNGWYVFEYAAAGNGPGPAMFAQLLDAQLLGSNVTITGTGGCDGGPAGPEVLSSVVSQ